MPRRHSGAPRPPRADEAGRSGSRDSFADRSRPRERRAEVRPPALPGVQLRGAIPAGSPAETARARPRAGIGRMGWIRRWPGPGLALGVRRPALGRWLDVSVGPLRTPADQARFGLRADHAVDHQPPRLLEALDGSLGQGTKEPVDGAWLGGRACSGEPEARGRASEPPGFRSPLRGEQTGRGEGGRKGLAPLGLRRTFSGEARGRQHSRSESRQAVKASREQWAGAANQGRECWFVIGLHFPFRPVPQVPACGRPESLESR